MVLKLGKGKFCACTEKDWKESWDARDINLLKEEVERLSKTGGVYLGDVPDTGGDFDVRCACNFNPSDSLLQKLFDKYDLYITDDDPDASLRESREEEAPRPKRFRGDPRSKRWFPEGTQPTNGR